MGSTTLLVRHLPSSMTKEEKEDFLRHFGAIRVRIMGNKGPLKHTAFAEFPNKDVAAQVLSKLHQVEVLGCRLVVEVAHSRDDQHFPTVSDSQPAKIKEEAEDENKKEEEKADEVDDNAFDFSFHQWGLKYPRRRRLHYLYPPPSPSILANISNALAACPRFYVQVLHLMNKMDLPAPFGPLTAQPPLAPDAGVTVDYEDYDKLQTEEMDVSSTEESEMESDTEADRPKEQAPRKRRRPDSMRQIKKRARLAMAMFQPAPAPDSTKPSVPAVPLQEVFEQAGEASGQRRIQLRLPSAVTDPVVPAVPSVEETEAPLPVPESSAVKTEETGEAGKVEQAAQSSGFGVITPVTKPAEESEDKDEEEGWTETKFISRSELRKGRLSHREMENVSIFRNYKEGEPSRRLYIKNLAKQVTEEDLHWIFGRYVNWENEMEKNIFDIRLMKEGRMKGQAFVTLGTDEQAVKAVRDTNAFVFKGKPMAVHFARSAKQQEDGKS